MTSGQANLTSDQIKSTYREVNVDSAKSSMSSAEVTVRARERIDGWRLCHDQHGKPLHKILDCSGCGNLLSRQIGDLPSPDRDPPSPGRDLPSPDRDLPLPDRDLPMPDRNLSSPDRNLPSLDRNVPSPDRNCPYQIGICGSDADLRSRTDGFSIGGLSRNTSVRLTA